MTTQINEIMNNVEMCLAVGNENIDEFELLLERYEEILEDMIERQTNKIKPWNAQTNDLE